MGRQILIKAFRPKTQLPVKCSPCEDMTGKLFTGQGKHGYYETLTEEEKRNLHLVVTNNTVMIITHDMVLRVADRDEKGNTKDEPGVDYDIIDDIHWQWLKRHPYLAMTRKDRNRDTSFYVENLEIEAEHDLKVSKPITKARYLIEYEASASQLITAAKALGYPAPESQKVSVLQKWLREYAETDSGRLVEAVLKVLSPDNNAFTNAKVLFEDLKKAGIVAKHAGNVWKYGGDRGTFLGRSESAVVDYIMDNENKENVLAMKDSLKSVHENATV